MTSLFRSRLFRSKGSTLPRSMSAVMTFAVVAALSLAMAPRADALMFGDIGKFVGDKVSKVGNFASKTYDKVKKSTDKIVDKTWGPIKNTVVGKGLSFAGGMVLGSAKELVTGAIQLGKGTYQLGRAGVQGVRGGIAYAKGDKAAARRYFSDSWKNLKPGALNFIQGAWKVAQNVPLPQAGALNALGKLGKAGQLAAKGWQGLAAARKLTDALPGNLMNKGAGWLTRIPGVKKGLSLAEGKAGSLIGKGGQWLQQRAGSLFGQGKFGKRVQGYLKDQTKQLGERATKSIRNLPKTISAKAVKYGMDRLGLKMPPRKRMGVAGKSFARGKAKAGRAGKVAQTQRKRAGGRWSKANRRVARTKAGGRSSGGRAGGARSKASGRRR